MRVSCNVKENITTQTQLRDVSTSCHGRNRRAIFTSEDLNQGSLDLAVLNYSRQLQISSRAQQKHSVARLQQTMTHHDQPPYCTRELSVQ